jgi:hypothetical protein
MTTIESRLDRIEALRDREQADRDRQTFQNLT